MKNYFFLFTLAITAIAQENTEIIQDKTFIFKPNLNAKEDLVIRPLKNPQVAAYLSSIFPGLGHFYLGEDKTAGALMGTAAMELGFLAAAAIEKNSGATIFSLLTFTNTVNYGIFAAYRDARNYNGAENYSHTMPTDQLADLTAAPFNFRVLKKPEVWGGCLGALALGYCVSHYALPKDVQITSDEKIAIWFPAAAIPIGIGEESLFRGFLQSYFAERLSPWGSITASSLLFGAAHIPNAFLLPEEHRWRYYSFSLPLITALGAYLGYLTQKNVSLQESVAVHTWYDFTIFSLSAVSQSAAIGCPSFSYSFQF